MRLLAAVLAVTVVACSTVGADGVVGEVGDGGEEGAGELRDGDGEGAGELRDGDGEGAGELRDGDGDDAEGGGEGVAGEEAPEPLLVGAGPDAESLLLGHVIAWLMTHGGVPATVVAFSDTGDGRQAIELGDVDLRVGYTGETWLDTLGRPNPPGDPRASFEAVREHDRDHDIVWLRPRFEDGIDQPPANSTFAFVVQGPPAVDADLHTMSQLAARLSERPEAAMCVDEEFGSRPDGLRAVLEAYSIRAQRTFLSADPEGAVRGVATGDCIAGLTVATDGRAWQAGQRPLIDDLRVFPAFVPLPQIRDEVLAEHPRIRTALYPLTMQLTTALLGRWNARVVAGEPIEEVAENAGRVLLERHGRLVPEPDEGS